MKLKSDCENPDRLLFIDIDSKPRIIGFIKDLYDRAVNFLTNADKTKVYIDGQVITVNGMIESNQQGEIRDCWLLSKINALAETDFGYEDIKNSITSNKNGSYTVDIKKLNKKYTITQEEFQKAIDSGEYSSGDPDMILFELALEKHYDKLLAKADKKAVKKGNSTISEIRTAAGNTHSIDGGTSVVGLKKKDFDNRDIMHLITGADTYCIVSKFGFDNVLDLKADNKNKIAMTFGSEYSITVNEETGETKIIPFNETEYDDGAHEYTIKDVIKDESGNIVNIIVGNPWDSKQDIPISKSEFDKVAMDMNIAVKDKKLTKKIEDIDKKDYYAKLIQDANSLQDDFSIYNFQSTVGNTYDTRLFVGYSGGVNKLYQQYLEKVKDYTEGLDYGYKTNGIDGMNEYIGKEIWNPEDEEVKKYLDDFMSKPIEERYLLNQKRFFECIGFSEDEANKIIQSPELLQEYCKKYDYIY